MFVACVAVAVLWLLMLLLLVTLLLLLWLWLWAVAVVVCGLVCVVVAVGAAVGVLAVGVAAVDSTAVDVTAVDITLLLLLLLLFVLLFLFQRAFLEVVLRYHSNSHDCDRPLQDVLAEHPGMDGYCYFNASAMYVNFYEQHGCSGSRLWQLGGFFKEAPNPPRLTGQ